MKRSSFLKSLVGIIAAPFVATKVIGELNPMRGNGIVQLPPDYPKIKDDIPEGKINEFKWEEDERFKNAQFRKPCNVEEVIRGFDLRIYNTDVNNYRVDDMIYLETVEDEMECLIREIDYENNCLIVMPLDIKPLKSKIGSRISKIGSVMSLGNE